MPGTQSIPDQCLLRLTIKPYFESFANMSWADLLQNEAMQEFPLPSWKNFINTRINNSQTGGDF